MEKGRLPHCNLSHTAKILCLINNGFLNFMIGMTYVTLGVLNAVIADSIGSTDGYITFVAGISIAITNFSGFIGAKVLKQIGIKYLTIVSTLLKCISTYVYAFNCKRRSVFCRVDDGTSCCYLLGIFNKCICRLGLIFGDHLSNAIGFVTLLLMIGTATPPATQVLPYTVDHGLNDHPGMSGFFLAVVFSASMRELPEDGDTLGLTMTLCRLLQCILL
ncbi:uncharacterized protein LOC117104582 [Anneissia japonica]|uniref:uncharacterized protein LOC117104582 n=1 Tax=Anneissia japonica TaxID=1529436 RepID=UPI001425AA1E|nr:uncharacterized protein LOC117104582 [Anneissia japonica]